MVTPGTIRLGEDAYGVPIAREIERGAGRGVALGSVYATLERLEEKGLVTSELGEPTAERGDQAKRYFHISAKGVREVRETQKILKNLWQGHCVNSKEKRHETTPTARRCHLASRTLHIPPRKCQPGGRSGRRVSRRPLPNMWYWCQALAALASNLAKGLRTQPFYVIRGLFTGWLVLYLSHFVSGHFIGQFFFLKLGLLYLRWSSVTPVATRRTIFSGFFGLLRVCSRVG